MNAGFRRVVAAVAAGAALLVMTAPAAAARERLAVFVLAEADPELSDNLTEVTIAKLAEARDYELVGRRELDVKLGEIPLVRDGGLAACVANAPCLAAVGVQAGARRAVIGNVERREAAYVVRLSLIDTASGAVAKRADAEAPAELPRLIATVQSAAVELMTTSPVRPSIHEDAGAPRVVPVAASVAPSPAQTGENGALFSSPPPDRAPEETPFVTYAGFGAAGLAVIAFSTAAITGSIASGPPSGDTRKERKDDIARRENYATAANVALAAGGVFSVTAILCFALP